MKKIIILWSIIIILLCAAIVTTVAISNIRAQCPPQFNTEPDVKVITKLALIGYLKNPSKSSLNEGEVRDIIRFHEQIESNDNPFLCNIVGSSSQSRIADIVKKIDSSIQFEEGEGCEQGECEYTRDECRESGQCEGSLYCSNGNWLLCNKASTCEPNVGCVDSNSLVLEEPPGGDTAGEQEDKIKIKK
jgi:hypothetical protein